MEHFPGTDMANLILSALGQTGEGIAIVDLSGNILYVNRAFAACHGYTEGELLGMSLSVFHRREDMPLVNGANRQVMETGSFSGEIPHLHRNGRVFPAVMHSSLVRDDLGRPIGIVGTMRDLTEIRGAVSELHEARQLLESVLNAIPDVIGIQDIDHTIVRYNTAGYEMLAIQPAEAEGRKCFELIGHSSPCTVCATSITLSSGKPACVEKHVPELGKWLEVRSYPIFDNSGNMVRVIEHLRDITAVKEAADRERKLEERFRVTQKLESLGVLAGGIAHDFNNILMVILGNTDLALSGEGVPEELKVYLKRIDEAARRAADLTGQMLDYSGKRESTLSPVRLNDLVQDTGGMLSISVSRKARLEYELNEPSPVVLADPSQLRQVIMNLITNASDALCDAPGDIILSVRARNLTEDDLTASYVDSGLVPGRYAEIRVSDTGCGMSDEILARVFEPFFTTKFTGRGLGMAAVLGIVKTHSGCIMVDSKEGSGTTISVCIPLAGDSTVTESKDSLELPGGTGRVLVVDDEETVRTVTVKMVERLGYTADYAANGSEAVALFERKPGGYQWVILDLTMPVMDGREALREILRLDPGARVIISSGFPRENIIEQLPEGGWSGILHKPYDIRDLAGTMRRAALEESGPGSSGKG